MTKTSRTKKTILLSAGKLTASVLSMFSAAILVRLITRDDFATYKQTFLAPSVAFAFFGLGVSQSLMYFLPREPGRQRSILKQSLWIVSLSGVVLVMCVLLGGAKLLAVRFQNPALTQALFLVAPYLVFEMLLRCVTPALVATDRTSEAAILGVLSRLVVVVCSLGGVLITGSYLVGIAGTALATSAMAIVGWWLILKKTPEDSDEIGRPVQLDEQVKYGFPLALSSVAGVLHRSLDKIVVAILEVPERFAGYAVGATELPLVNIVTSSAATATLPDLSSMMKDGDVEEVCRVWRRFVSAMARILLPCFFFFSSRQAVSFACFTQTNMATPLRRFAFTCCYCQAASPSSAQFCWRPVLQSGC